MKRQLSLREKAFIGIAALFVLVLAVYYFLISPGMERSRLLDRLIRQKERELQELYVLKGRYETLKAEEDRIIRWLATSRGKVSPLSELEAMATKTGLKDHLQQMKPLPSISTPRYTLTPVQMRFVSVEPSKVVSYLYALENAPLPLQIKRVTLKASPRFPGRLDVSLEVLTFSPPGR